MQTVAYFATLDNLTPGTALRTAEGHVHFLTQSTQLWTELFDVDIPRLQLLGLVGETQAQHAFDTLAGGYAAICTARQNMEVA